MCGKPICQRSAALSYPFPACGGGRMRAQRASGGGSLKSNPTPGSPSAIRPFPFSGGIRKLVSIIARVVWRAPGTPVFLATLAFARGWRADGRSQSLCAHLLAKVRRLSARHRGAFRRPGRASGGCIVSASALRQRPLLGSRAFEPRARREPAVSQFLAGGRTAPRAEPRRRPGLRRLPYLPPAGAAPCPIITTPLDGAVKRARRSDLIPRLLIL